MLIVKGKEDGAETSEVYVAYLYDQIQFAKQSNYVNGVGYFTTKAGSNTGETLGISGTDSVFDLDVDEIDGLLRQLVDEIDFLTI